MSAVEQAPVEKKVVFKEKNVNEQNVVLDAHGRYGEVLHPKGWEGLWFDKQIKAMEAYEDMVAGAELEGKDLQRYEELKKDWKDSRDEVVKIEKHVPPRIVKEQAEAGATRNRESIQQALNKVKEEAEKLKEKKIAVYRYLNVEEKKEETAPLPEAEKKPVEEEKLTSKPKTLKDAVHSEKSNAWMGIFDTYTGGKVPDTVTTERLRRYVESVGRSQGKNTLAYAYAESLLKNAVSNTKEKPARQEAETHREEATKLEEENVRLKEELAALNKMEEEGGIFQEPTDGAKSRLERKKAEVDKELQSKKKGWGAKFADGFKKLFGKFSKNHEKEIKLEGLDEYGFIHKPETVKRLDEYGFVHEEKKPEEPPVTLSEALKEEKIVPVEEPEQVEQEKTTEVHPNPELDDMAKKQIDVATAKYMAERAQEEEMSKKEQGRIKGKTVWGWLKGMTGGLANMNLKEVGKVLNLYSEAKNIAGDARAQTELIKQEKGLLFDQDEAWDEAWEVDEKMAKDEKDWIESYGAEPERAKKLAVRYLAEQISFQKKELNKANEDRIVLLSLQKLQKEYAATHKGRELAPERTAQVEQKLREEIGKLRKGQIRKSFFDFAKLFKESLNDKRWAATVETMEKVAKVKL